jgi:hypothetical protein
MQSCNPQLLPRVTSADCSQDKDSTRESESEWIGGDKRVEKDWRKNLTESQSSEPNGRRGEIQTRCGPVHWFFEQRSGSELWSGTSI